MSIEDLTARAEQMEKELRDNPGWYRNIRAADIIHDLRKALHGYQSDCASLLPEADAKDWALGEMQMALARAKKAELDALSWHRRAYDLAKAWFEIIQEDGVDHDDEDCPQDDTCRCANIAKINAVFGKDGLGMGQRP